MYIPDHFAPKDARAAWRLVEAYPFATVIAYGNDDPFISHLPLLLEQPADGPARLIGHMARRNRQWEVFAQAPQALAVFNGPHAYVTPRWYAAHDVPTWNYAVVHAYGQVRLRETHQEVAQIVARLTARFESGPDAWRFALPDDLAGDGALAQAIVGFELTIDRLEVKIKLGQNRSAADRAGVRAGLATRTDDGSRAVLELMEELGV